MNLDFLKSPGAYFKARENPQKYFKNFGDWRNFYVSGFKSDAQNSYTDQQAINKWLMSGGDDEDMDREFDPREAGGKGKDRRDKGDKGGKGGKGLTDEERRERRRKKRREEEEEESEGMTLAEIQHQQQLDLLYTRGDIAKEIMSLENHYNRERNELQTYVGLLGGFFN